MTRKGDPDRRRRGTVDGGDIDPIRIGDEFDPALTRSHKWGVSGRETTPELNVDDAAHPEPPRPLYDQPDEEPSP